jgi:hypothetical protein
MGRCLFSFPARQAVVTFSVATSLRSELFTNQLLFSINASLKQKENVTLDAQYVFTPFRLKTKSSWLQVEALYMIIRPRELIEIYELTFQK